MKRAVIAIACFLSMSSAFAAVIGQLDLAPSGDTIVFTDSDASFCVGGSKVVHYVIGDNEKSRAAKVVGQQIPGCWMVARGQVAMEFADGDSGVIAIGDVNWKAGMKPAQFTL